MAYGFHEKSHAKNARLSILGWWKIDDNDVKVNKNVLEQPFLTRGSMLWTPWGYEAAMYSGNKWSVELYAILDQMIWQSQ